MSTELLIIPDKPDIERDSIAKAWMDAGGTVQRIGKFWIKPKTQGFTVSLYGFDSFCLVLAQILKLTLSMVQDDWIAALPYPYLKRNIQISSIKEINSSSFPLFVKPVIPKLFKAEIFKDLPAFKDSIQNLQEDNLLICSEIIQVSKEVRCFILHQEIMAISYYEGSGSLEEPTAFVLEFLSKNILKFPNTFVLDLGFNEMDGWFIVEFNSTWGAGLNGCSPQAVVPCIRAASNASTNPM